MSLLNRFILKLKRADSPFFRFAKKSVWMIFNPTLPRIPQFFKPPLRVIYEAHFIGVTVARSILSIFYRNPIFQGRCTTFGKGVSIDGLPFVTGHIEIHLGDYVKIGGNVSILSGRVFDNPRLIIKDRSAIGWNTTLSANREIVIEEDVMISYDCRISDADGHRREADLRAQGEPPKAKDVLPVRICRNAWIGNGTHIMKGVTIGEGAIVGANSVVISNIPPYALAMGNPAEVMLRNVGLPSTAVRKRKTQAGAEEGQGAKVAPQE
jgi:acetyltransferase-like isoleucine patch superfamily enzyme